jgi:hypothetical protein
MRLGWRSSSMQMEEAADNKVRGVSTAGVLIQLEHVAAMSSAADITEYAPSDVAKKRLGVTNQPSACSIKRCGVGFKSLTLLHI